MSEPNASVIVYEPDGIGRLYPAEVRCRVWVGEWMWTVPRARMVVLRSESSTASTATEVLKGVVYD